VFGAVWIALALALAVQRKRPDLFPLVAATVFVSDELTLGLKHLIGRKRPYVENPEPEPLMTTSLDLSFPSGHAATSFAGATLLAVLVPRFALPIYALAAAISWSRVYVGVHFPLDVLGGALLGAALALAASRLTIIAESGSGRPTIR
jgi:undecaprenyl-diphosphatase